MSYARKLLLLSAIGNAMGGDVVYRREICVAPVELTEEDIEKIKRRISRERSAKRRKRGEK